MDATTTAILGPWTQLGVVGSVVIALGFVCWRLWGALDKRTESHMAAVKECADQTRGFLEKKFEADLKLAAALDRNTDVMEAGLQALKSR